MLAFIVEMSDILACFINPDEKASGPSQNACSVLAQSLIHDLVFSGESKKQCLFKKPESDPALDVDQVGENINSALTVWKNESLDISTLYKKLFYFFFFFRTLDGHASPPF